MKKILPILLAIIGIGAGVGAGIMLKPAPQEVVTDDPCGDAPHETVAEAPKIETSSPEALGLEYAEMTNQFVVPLISNDLVSSMVVLSLSIEVPLGQSDLVYEREPKLRDSFLQVMFDHANMGGFSGNFTTAASLEPLRGTLVKQAKRILPGVASDVLIMDILRQDV